MAAQDARRTDPIERAYVRERDRFEGAPTTGVTQRNRAVFNGYGRTRRCASPSRNSLRACLYLSRLFHLHPQAGIRLP